MDLGKLFTGLIAAAGTLYLVSAISVALSFGIVGKAIFGATLLGIAILLGKHIF